MRAMSKQAKILERISKPGVIVELHIPDLIGQDPKSAQFTGGEISLLDFVASITPEDPYKLQMTPDGNYVVVPRGATTHTDTPYNTRHTRTALWNNVAEVKSMYPEVSGLIDDALARAEEPGCTNCVRNRHAVGILKAMYEIGPKDYTSDQLKTMLTPAFANALVNSGNNQDLVEEPKEIASTGSIRPTCLDCCRKHIAQAIVLLNESKMGYPNHRWLAVGHLAEASEESIGEYEDLAQLLRGERLSLMDNPDYLPDTLMDFFDVIDDLEAS
jgi:hypothetical protein